MTSRPHYGGAQWRSGLGALLMLAACAGCTTPVPRALSGADFLSMDRRPVEGKEFDNPVYVYARGDRRKPPLLLLHELPGLSEPTLEYARELSEHFTVYVPRLFGDTGQQSSFRGMLAYQFNGDWDESTVDGFASRRITRWLRLVLARIERDHPGQSVAIIGMCLSGDLPLALAAGDNPANPPHVKAVVVAQPTLPMSSLVIHRDALGISDEEYRRAAALANKGNLKVYAVRFRTDSMARREKFERMRRDLGGGFCDGEIDNERIDLIPGEPRGEPIRGRAHSSLVGELDDVDAGTAVAFRRHEVVTFLLNVDTLPPRRTSLCGPVR
jgi:dienelactone hydrolase